MSGLAEMVPGPAFMQDADEPRVQAFIAAHDVENECSHGRLPHEGCAACETPDLMPVLSRVPARRALERVAAAANVEHARERVAA